MISTDYPINGNEYYSQTKWSDFRTSVPTIYNYYYRLELVLKGFIILKENEEIKLNHNIEMLFNNFKSKYSNEDEINKILEKYIVFNSLIEPFKTFFRENNISTNKFYFALSYPPDQKLNNIINHFYLKYREKEGIDFFKTLKDDSADLRKLFLTLSQKYK